MILYIYKSLSCTIRVIKFICKYNDCDNVKIIITGLCLLLSVCLLKGVMKMRTQEYRAIIRD